MSEVTLPPNHAARRSITSRINRILSDYGLENAVSGGKFDDLRQEIDGTTGYWEGRSLSSKPSRLIVHLSKLDQIVLASIPKDNNNGNFAYANTAKRPVGGLSVRILPVINVGHQKYQPYPEWEWLLWYCFWPKLEHGSSGQVFDGFDPANGRFTYMGKEQRYIAAGLVTLNSEDDVFHDQSNNLEIFYRDATESIENLIRVAPASPLSAAATVQEGQIDG